ncbi:MAG: hypothetical protein HOE61_10105 [Candidatus Marinimicrobia bacterium]|nr:hypothetical protein [Candidatus Neomarinimicrobiota bacterium]
MSEIQRQSESLSTMEAVERHLDPNNLPYSLLLCDKWHLTVLDNSNLILEFLCIDKLPERPGELADRCGEILGYMLPIDRPVLTPLKAAFFRMKYVFENMTPDEYANLYFLTEDFFTEEVPELEYVPEHVPVRAETRAWVQSIVDFVLRREVR